MLSSFPLPERVRLQYASRQLLEISSSMAVQVVAETGELRWARNVQVCGSGDTQGYLATPRWLRRCPLRATRETGDRKRLTKRWPQQADKQIDRCYSGYSADRQLWWPCRFKLGGPYRREARSACLPTDKPWMIPVSSSPPVERRSWART